MQKQFLGMLLAMAVGCTFLGGNVAMANDRTEVSNAAVTQLYKGKAPEAIREDAELSTIIEKFIYADVANNVKLSVKEQALLRLVVLAANNTTDDYEKYVIGALNAGAKPEEIRETIFHTTPYIGFAKAKEAMEDMYEAFDKAGVRSPAAAGTVTDATRYTDGFTVQSGIFGDGIAKGDAAAPADMKHIRRFLSANCFGDYYTRQVLDLKQRELITFTAIAALGGCEAQVKAHALGNLNVGNTRQNLIDAVTVALPFIGYPRTLNAMACIDEIAPAK